MADFDYFVIFAEMRTGSNFLESNLNAIEGLSCLGEAFNPHFIGYPNRDQMLGMDQTARDAEPLALIAAVKAAPGLAGFRYFHDHDPRVLDGMLDDPRCAKIILTRNPAESYVSWKIAQATGQWKMTNVKNVRSEVITFDAPEFEAMLGALQDFQLTLLHRLQARGQTAFYIDYEDINDLEVMNGIAAFLGVPGRLVALDRTLKKQNPEPLSHKVANYPEMAVALAELDRFNLSRTPNFEPRRGPMVPQYIAAAQSPLLYMPLKGGPVAAMTTWLTALDKAAPQGGFTQKTLREWRRAHPGHRSFTVVRHPLARAHAAFCDHILGAGPQVYGEIRDTLKKQFKLPMPKDTSPEAHHAAFRVFLQFLKANLGGQTAIRVDPAWASQTAVIQGFAQIASPDLILHEDRLAAGLAFLTGEIGMPCPPLGETDPHAVRLREILDDELQQLARDIYARDFETFGFSLFS